MNHDFYIQRCLQIAKNGIGSTSPNPSVGAIIVLNSKIIGEGFTSAYGGHHAEVNAIHAVANKALLKQATLYVTLEPCAHFGKTPPCADLIIKHQLKNVVIGCVDTHEQVAGKGIKRLEDAGVNVIVGVLEDACKEHHKRFFTVQNKKRPYIILKWAETKDGFIAPETKTVQKPVWISNAFSQQLVHQLRSKEHAILVGTNTVIADNPKLNVRSWTGDSPIRIVLDQNLRIPSEANVYDGSIKTIVITASKSKSQKHKENIVFESINFSKNVAEQICEVLQKHQIMSVIIEGGTQTLQTFIDADLWDEAKVFVGDVYLEKGVRAPVLSAKNTTKKSIKNDLLITYMHD